MASEQVRSDDLEAPLEKLKDRDFVENLSQDPPLVEFVEKYVNTYKEYSLYFYKSLIVDTTKYMQDALNDLEKEFKNEPMTTNVKHSFDNYNQLLLFMKSERERNVKSIKELVELFLKSKEDLLAQIDQLKKELEDMKLENEN